MSPPTGREKKAGLKGVKVVSRSYGFFLIWRVRSLWGMESSFKLVAMSPLEGRVSWPWARE